VMRWGDDRVHGQGLLQSMIGTTRKNDLAPLWAHHDKG